MLNFDHSFSTPKMAFLQLGASLWSITQVSVIISVAFIVYGLGVVIHRLYFSPYAKFPGPKLAGLTYGYMFYYDAVAGRGRYYKKIEQMHEEYASPVVRIAPYELHVNDPAFYEILFAGAYTKRDKPPTWSQAFSNVDSVFGTIHHDQHRIRRAALNPFFSPASLRRLEPLIQDNVSRLISVFRRFQRTGEILPLRPAFAALTSDIIGEYCFGGGENYIEAPGFNAMVLDATDALTENMHVTVQLQWLPKLMDKLPDKLVEAMVGPGLAKFNDLKRHCISKIKETMKNLGDFRDVEYRTIFHDLLENPSLPPEDKTVDRLWQEAQLLLSAGTVTTATAIGSALVYLLLDPERMKILLEELEAAMPDVTQPKKEAELERLPYLNAVVQETLRLVSGVSYRLVRSAPTETLQVGKWTIPPNTAVSMHAPLIHHSPAIFPSPWSFIPERWLPASAFPPRPPGIPEANPKYIVSFSKGTRHCLGMPLAHAEIYITLSRVLRTFARLERNDTGQVATIKGIKLYETDRGDVDMKADMGFPSPEKGRGNIRVILE